MPVVFLFLLTGAASLEASDQIFCFSWSSSSLSPTRAASFLFFRRSAKAGLVLKEGFLLGAFGDSNLQMAGDVGRIFKFRQPSCSTNKWPGKATALPFKNEASTRVVISTMPEFFLEHSKIRVTYGFEDSPISLFVSRDTFKTCSHSGLTNKKEPQWA